MTRQIRVGITHGDFNGIGYEIILKALSHEAITEICTPVIFGYHSLADKMRQQLGFKDMKIVKADNSGRIHDGKINIIDLGGNAPQPTPGKPTDESGRAAVSALEKATEALAEGDIDVIVTAPISKEAVQSDKFSFPGHTEYLEFKAGGDAEALMIMASDRLKVALVSIHLPLKDVATAVTKDKIVQTAVTFEESLIKDFGIHKPRIAVLSLNPHSGDGGLLGKEEAEIIAPAIEELKKKHVLAFGPYPADGFFGSGDYQKFDGIVAMYHDQGLIPFKAIVGPHGVNFTAGLPFVRTSPDHGTAFDIAWKGVADETSMREAIYSAIDISRKRKNHEKISANPLKKYMVDRPDRGERMEKSQEKQEEK